MMEKVLPIDTLAPLMGFEPPALIKHSAIKYNSPYKLDTAGTAPQRLLYLNTHSVSLLIKFLQPCIANSKMMCYFMLNYSSYLSNHLGITLTAFSLDWLLKYGYLVRWHKAIAMASFG